jgi:hypothetical protein
LPNFKVDAGEVSKCVLSLLIFEVKEGVFEIGIISHERLDESLATGGLIICELVKHTLDKF